ncbi:MAG: hypothetical protein FIA91_06020 [Geobacter sp.]|nr:hypothetical protein [Geobacter sp.]
MRSLPGGFDSHVPPPNNILTVSGNLPITIKIPLPLDSIHGETSIILPADTTRTAKSNQPDSYGNNIA